jgi:predicted DsbA family dithiol-disulfide isomerase
VKIEFWSDIICPWCGLTDHRIGLAIERFEHGDEVELIHRSFQLHPEMPRDGMTQLGLSAQHGMDAAIAARILRPIEQMAESDGLVPYHALDRSMGPTDFAHELLAYASTQGKHEEAWSGMFREHFGAGRKLWTIDQVVDFAGEIGLDRGEARDALESRRFRRQVEGEQQDAQRLGATGTPFIVIDGKYGLSGARDTESLLAAMRQVWAETHPAPTLTAIGRDGETCGIDGCDAPSA